MQSALAEAPAERIDRQLAVQRDSAVLDEGVGLAAFAKARRL